MRSVIVRALTLTCLCVAGCATKEHKSADEYFRQATEDFRIGAYTPAIDGFRELLDEHPFSQYTQEVELKIAHAQYLNEDWVAAIISFSDFQRRYPTSPFLPFVGYHLGMCYLRQMGTFDRDQSAAQSAHAYFSTLISQYPESPFADLAREQLGRCRESLAAHELNVARFYERRGNGRAAELRRLLMAAEYGETTAAADALLALTQEYARLDNQQYATLAYRALRGLHPTSEQLRSANGLVRPADDAALPPTSDPIDLLLIAQGRNRPSAVYAIPEPPRTVTRGPGGAGAAPGPGPAFGPIDPFGRGGVGY